MYKILCHQSVLVFFGSDMNSQANSEDSHMSRFCLSLTDKACSLFSDVMTGARHRKDMMDRSVYAAVCQTIEITSFCFKSKSGLTLSKLAI